MFHPKTWWQLLDSVYGTVYHVINLSRGGTREEPSLSGANIAAPPAYQARSVRTNYYRQINSLPFVNASLENN